MILKVDRRGARVLARSRFALLLLVSVAIGHDAAYVMRFGFGPSLAGVRAATGHDGTGTLVVVAAGLALAALVAAGVWRLVTLERRSSRTHGLPALMDGPSWAAETIALWRRLGPIAVLAFFLRENAEAFAAVGDVPGFAVLLDPAPLAVPSLLLVTLVLAALGGLVRWRIRVLVTRLVAVETGRAQHSHRADAPPREWRRVSATAPHLWMIVRLDAGRAPPAISD